MTYIVETEKVLVFFQNFFKSNKSKFQKSVANGPGYQIHILETELVSWMIWCTKTHYPGM